jgi:hypothetical protein
VDALIGTNILIYRYDSRFPEKHVFPKNKRSRRLLEIKGFEPDQTSAKSGGATRCVTAVNNRGQLGRWAFHLCRNPQMLESELQELAGPS